MTDYVNDNLANPADPVDINVRPGGVAEASWWGASRQKFVLDAIASLRTYAKAIPATVTTAANAAAAASAAVTALVSALAAQVSTNLAEVLNNPSAGVSGSTSVRFRSNAGVLERSEAGGAYKPTWAHDNVSVSASGGAIALTVREHLNLELAADAAVTFGALTLAGGALSQNKGVHLTMHVTQDGTGYHKVTWPSWLKASFLQPRQGPGQESAFHFTSESDGTFRLVAFDAIDTRRPLHVRDYGADPTNTLDSAPAINACVFDAGHTYFTKAILDHGEYRTDDTIHLGYNSFNSVTLEGEGYAYDGNAAAFRGSALVPTFSDRPCVNFQAARGSRLVGVALRGKLVNWIDSQGLGAFGRLTGLNDVDPANWNDPGLAATQDSRYAPYAGVSVDAYAGNQPATHYPAVSYPAALGVVAQYNKPFSSDCHVIDCQIRGFTVGVVNQPCDADGNGDFTKVVRCTIEYCKYGVSIGNTQSRNFAIENCQYGLIHTFITNNKHGHKIGKFGGPIINPSGGSCIQFFDLNGTSNAGPIKVMGSYAEAIYRIGSMDGITAVETGIEFDGSLWDFGLQDKLRGIPAQLIVGPSAGLGDEGANAIIFRMTTLTDIYSVAAFGYPVRLEGKSQLQSQVRATAPSVPSYVALAHNATMGGLVLPYLRNMPQGMKSPCYDVDAGTLGPFVTLEPGDFYFGASGFTPRKYCLPLYTENVCSPNGAREQIVRPSADNNSKGSAHAKGSGYTSITFSGTSMTFLDHLADEIAFRLGGFPGDILWDQDTQTVFFIRSRVNNGDGTSTVIAEAQNNLKWNGSAWVIDAAIPTGTGYMYSENARYFVPTYPILVDTTASSGTLANAGRDDGYGAFLDTDLAVGDVLGGWNAYTDGWTNDFNNQLTAVTNGAPGSLAIHASGAFRTISRKRLSIFIRKPPANV